MTSAQKFLPNLVKIALVLLVLLGLFASRSVSYQLFHTLAELFSIIIAGTIFVITWNFRKFYQNSFLVFIGTAFLFIGLIDLFHTMAYKGMGVFPTYDADLPTQFWIAGRYMQSLTLLVAPVFLRRKARIEVVAAGYLVVTVLLFLSIFQWGIFPVSFIEGSGLTPFKVISEYVIIAILAVAGAILTLQRALLDRKVLTWMLLAIGITMLSELTFTLYTDVFGLFNLLGHFLKIVAFFLIYKALLETEAGSIYADMTALRSAQTALQEQKLQTQRSLAQLQSIYASIPVGLCFLDTSLRYQAINDTLAEINGHPAADHIGRTVREMLAPAISSQIAENAETVIQTGQPILNLEFTRPDSSLTGGETCWMLNYHPVFDSSGQVLGVNCVIQNITERKCAEEALQASEKRFRSVFESNMIGMVFKNARTGQVLDANDEFLRIIGHTRAELEAGQINWMRITPPEDVVREQEAYVGLQSGQRLQPLEKEYLRPDGTRIPVIFGGSFLDNDHEHMVAFVLDNTERKAAETELAEASRSLHEYAERLKRSNQELEEFAFVASHDLQEPLRKIKTFGGFLRKKLQDVKPEETRSDLVEDAAHMHSAADRMQKMIEGLLELSRVNRRGGEFERVSLKELTNDVVDDLDARIAVSGARIIVADLPEVHVDPLQIRRLLQNLIGNALKFHRPGVPPLIEVSGAVGSADGQADQVTLVVKDNGIGFDEKYAGRIFQPFQRLHGRSEYEGTGLGLSICQKIVERHHGTIEASGIPGEGAVFRITLPVQQPEM